MPSTRCQAAAIGRADRDARSYRCGTILVVGSATTNRVSNVLKSHGTATDPALGQFDQAASEERHRVYLYPTGEKRAFMGNASFKPYELGQDTLDDGIERLNRG